jgi:hypothetical protein
MTEGIWNVPNKILRFKMPIKKMKYVFNEKKY